MKHIALIGFPNSGKSYLGEKLANRFAYPFIDTDEEMLRCHGGNSVREVYQTIGETLFRREEERILREILRGPTSIVATGGGAVLHPYNRVYLSAFSKIFYLCPPLGWFESQMDKHGLPLSFSSNDIEAVLEERDPLYRGLADMVVTEEEWQESKILWDLEQAVRGFKMVG